MIGDRIKELRVSHKYTQTVLATKLGVTKQAVSNWENNNIVPSIEQLIKLSQLFGVPSDYILELSHKANIDVEGLSLEQIAHIQAIIADLKRVMDY